MEVYIVLAAILSGIVGLIWLFGRQPLWLLALCGVFAGIVIVTNLDFKKNLYAKHNFNQRTSFKVIR